jgi:hypothetical protein
MWKEIGTAMKKLIDIFHYFAKAPKKSRSVLEAEGGWLLACIREKTHIFC